jgi:ABC-type sulfate/molybdate transport systems ATPase subunit
VIAVHALDVRVTGFALEQITFTVPPGALAVVTGATGAGKTTLVEAIGGVRTITSGRIVLHDTDVTSMPPEARRVGLVYQQAMLFPHLTVAQNVEYAAHDAVVTAELVRELQLDALLHKPVHSLSGGERQLVALARAMACGPTVLLLDEPFAAMDAPLRARTRASVLQWAAHRSVTIMLVTHDSGEAQLPNAVRLHLHHGTLTHD